MTSNLNVFHRLISECMTATGLSRADAERAVRSRYPEFAPSAPALSGAETGMGAEAQLNAIAKRIAAERRISFAQGYVEALNSDPNLYLAYLKEQQAKLGGEARRG